MKPYIPVYCRPPNKLLKYVTSNFDDGAGHTGQLTTAHFLDKNKKEAEMVAYVKWDKNS